MSDKDKGRFIWYDLLTSDPKQAVAFYTHVVGWTAQPWENADYTMFVGSQGPLGGASHLPEQAKKMGAPPHWASNVQVTDVDVAAALARKLDGKVYVEPTDYPKVGRLAVIADPQGAVSNIFKPNSPMSAHDSTKSGEFTWSELVSTDHEAGFRFYNALFGWEKMRDHDMGAMGKYLIFGREGKDLGGMFTKSKAMPMPSAWLYYVQVTDLDAAIARATSKGAKVINGPMEVPGGARIVQAIDPQGAMFALHEAAKAK